MIGVVVVVASRGALWRQKDLTVSRSQVLRIKAPSHEIKLCRFGLTNRGFQQQVECLKFFVRALECAKLTTRFAQRKSGAMTSFVYARA